ncbi:NAD(P)/FAD-dependent oxidoreductase [Eupransor demetentiae]|uniref:Ferredoxin--NADP reductase n=1 Tax=Eupransor demetentiae TaxID=3109584 RepID=A0ABM9N5E3_9LACO|nr:Thioredoxin reductase (TrxB) [Lactobacillaceae bacterium LMG 33000]
MEEYEIAIIGGGPVGLFAAFYAGLRQTKVALLEALPELGGQPLALYPDKSIYDVAGFPGVSGRELVDRLQKQVALFNADIYTGTPVTDLQAEGEHYLLTYEDAIHGKQQLKAKTVIIATGKGSFEPRKLQLPEAEALEGQGLHYFANRPSEFAGQDVAVVGGGDSAVDLANLLATTANQVSLIHRRNNFRAMESSVAALQASDVDVLTPQTISQITRQPSGQLQVALEPVKDGEQLPDLLVDALIIQYGFMSRDKIMRNWHLPLKRDDFGIEVSDQIKTEHPGVFAIGDVTSFEEHVDLLATGFGQAPAAVNAAINHFDPDRGGPGHSSSLVID